MSFQPQNLDKKQDKYDRRDELIKRFDEANDSAFDILLKVITAEKTYNEKFGEVDLTKIRQIRERVEEESRIALDQIKTVLDMLRTQSRELGISKYAGIFEQESKHHERMSGWWLSSIMLLIIITLAYGFVLSYSVETTTRLENSNYIFLVTVSRLLIFTVLLYGLSLCVKNYKANKHNQVINRHRHNALVTFETFTTAASNDPDTKNAVLLEATRSIFNSQGTGYSSGEGDSEMSPNKIIEIVKSAKS